MKNHKISQQLFFIRVARVFRKGNRASRGFRRQILWDSRCKSARINAPERLIKIATSCPLTIARFDAFVGC
jgi:hypothetical protein